MDDIKVYPEDPHTNPQTGFLGRFTNRATPTLHKHMYYELFITRNCDLLHYVNGKEFLVKSNTLVFIRPDDIHRFQIPDGSNTQLINITFTRSVASELFGYIGDAIPIDALLNSELPPTAYLSDQDTQQIWSYLEYINTISRDDVKRCKLEYKILLFEIFTKHFSQAVTKTSKDIPVWLKNTCRMMQHDKNFIYGFPKMVELCGRSPEHLCRSMKRYYGITPTEYIENLRLSYAVNMLLNSGMSVLDICFESGFQNVSWFNSLFKKKHGMSPSKFRKKNAFSKNIDN